VRILISAGEASGEMYGAELIAALRRREPSLEFFGVGGERMRAAGCDIVVDARALAVVGITEIVSHLPEIYRLFDLLIAEADKRRPDLAIVIDSPAFNWRVARQMHHRGIPVAYYVCPQFWAWRRGRVKLLRKYVSRALTIFPFEEKFYRDRGVNATFVGHPLAELPEPSGTREQFARSCGLDPAKPWIALMPGSRRKEVLRNLPEMLRSAQLLGPEYQYMLPVASTLDPAWIRQQFVDLGQHPGIFIALTSDAHASLHHARGGIIASGTATVEAAMMATPFVMVYRVSALTYLLGRWRVHVPHFAMVNLIAGEDVVPELVQQRFTAENVVSRLKPLLADGPERGSMLQGLARVQSLLRAGAGGASGNQSPSNRAANIILELLRAGPGR
jgi:lipid-A-disaccharide synthase